MDGDGKIDYQEWLAAAFDHKKLFTKENLTKAFKIFDLNNDNYIQASEFYIVLPTNNLSSNELSRTRTLWGNEAHIGCHDLGLSSKEENVVFADNSTWIDMIK